MNRMNRRNRWLGGFALAAAASHTVTVAGAACSPTLTNLGTLGGAYSVATAIDEKGNVVGYSDTATGLEHAFEHKGMAMSDLADKMPLDLRALPSRAEAINGARQVAGTVNGRQMWRYTPATRRFQASPDPIYYYMRAVCTVNGMAADGALVARSVYPGVPDRFGGALALHPEYINSETYTDDASGYYTPACFSLRAAMNGRGDVTWHGVGQHGADAYSLRNPDGLTFPWGPVWHAPQFQLHGKTRTNLLLERLNGNRQSAATASDTAYCGYRWEESEGSRALVFDANGGPPGTFKDLGPGLYGPGGTSAAKALSDDGRWVVGHSAAPGSACDRLPTTATLFRRVDLADHKPRVVDVTPADTNVVSSQAFAVNDRSQVLGSAVVRKDNGTTVQRRFVYTPDAGAKFLDALFPELSAVEADLFQNQRGQIAGTALIAGQRRAFRIDCAGGS